MGYVVSLHTVLCYPNFFSNTGHCFYLKPYLVRALHKSILWYDFMQRSVIAVFPHCLFWWRDNIFTYLKHFCVGKHNLRWGSVLYFHTYLIFSLLFDATWSPPTIRHNLILDRRECKKNLGLKESRPLWKWHGLVHTGFFSIRRREELFYSQRLSSSFKSQHRFSWWKGVWKHTG